MPPTKEPSMKTVKLSPDHKLLVDFAACGNSTTAFARKYGLARTTARERLEAAKRRLGLPIGGLSPALEPDGCIPQKSSVLYNSKGDVKLEWRKMLHNSEQVAEWIKGMAKTVKPLDLISPPKTGRTGLMGEICVGDHHHGLRSWHKETGADWNSDISAKVLATGVRLTLQQLPRLDKITFTTMGDFYHADNRQAETEKSRHRLDVDGRYARTAESGAAALQAAIAQAARCAPEVEVIILGGNHDYCSSVWLAMLMEARFARSKHVKVRTHPASRQYTRWGKTLIGYQHGDMVKPGTLPSLMPQEMRKEWSVCKWSVWHLCHYHSRIGHSQRDLWEKPGVVVEYVPTLTAPDAYAADNGFISNRAISSYVYDQVHGPKTRLEIGYDEVMSSLKP